MEDIEDIDGVQMGHSLPLDSPALLTMEEEYRNTLCKGEERDVEVPPMIEWTRLFKHRVWDEPICKPM